MDEGRAAREAANDEVERAIGEVIKLGGDQRYLTEWVALAVTRPIEGADDSRYSWIVPTHRPPYHALIGLIETCLVLIKESLTSDD